MFNILDKIKWPVAIPCLPLLLIIILSALPIIFSYTYHISLYVTLPFIIPVLFLIYFSTKNPKRDLIISCISISSALLTTYLPNSHISIHEKGTKSYIKVKGTVKNVHYYNESLTWDAVESAKVSLKLQKIYKDGKWYDCSGVIQLYDRDSVLQFGDRVTCEGALFTYKKSDEFKLFSYNTYLKSKGITHWMRLDTIEEKESASGLNYLLKKCYSFRDWIISRASQGLNKEEDKKLLASMFFGYKGLLSPDEKEVYKRSGTVHLFAVSGLHIGIAAGFILLMLRIFRLNLKAQTLTLIGLLGVYVIMTGAPSSAVRAFVMISVWSIARGFMLPSNGLNNIAFSAVILLLFNPLNLISAGFYYTFIITAFLVITYMKSIELYQDLTEKKLWKGRMDWNTDWNFKIFLLFTCCLSAALATFGLNILINEQVIPFSFITNMVASTLAWLSFMLAIFSISALPFLYFIQEKVLAAIRFTSESGEFSWYTSSSVFLICLYYLFLFVLPYTQSKRKLRIMGPVIGVLIVFLAWPGSKNQISISVPSSSNVATIQIDNENRTYLINCSSPQLARELFHKEIHSLILPDIRAEHIKALENVLRNCTVKEIIIFRKPTAYFKRIVQEHDSSHLVKISSQHHLVKSFNIDKKSYSISFADSAPGQNSVSLELNREILSKTHLKAFIFSVDKKPLEKEFSFSYSNNGYLERFSF